jgi:hypothetical protein
MAKSDHIKLTKKNFVEKQKVLGLFDHIKHIRQIQDPDYFDKISEADQKSFNHYMILRALSMDPSLLDVITLLYSAFDEIPSKQFYKLLISLIPINKTYYPWVKSSKHKFDPELVDMMIKRFEVSPQEANEYISLLFSSDEGKNSLVYICQGFGKNDKEIEKLLASDIN